jgi:hypothetical protein
MLCTGPAGKSRVIRQLEASTNRSRRVIFSLMDIDLAALPGDVKTLRRMVRLLAADRTSLSEAPAEIERLHLIVKKLQRSQFGRRAERLDDDQLQLGFEDLNADLARAQAILPSAKAITPRTQDERPSLPAHLPREDRRFDVEHRACSCCGSTLTEKGPCEKSGSSFLECCRFSINGTILVWARRVRTWRDADF